MNARRGFFRAGLAAVTGGLVGRSWGADVQPATVTPLDGFDTAGPVTVTRTGQTLSFLDPSRRRIVAADPAEPTKRWTALGADGGVADVPGTVAAIASLDSSTMLVLWNDGGEWSLRAHRVRPPGTDGAEATLQTVALGRADGDGAGRRVDLVISPSRTLFAVVGLPAPLPPILRGRITGVRLDAPSERRCPALDGRQVAALTFGPGDEWVVLTVAPGADSTARLEWYASSGGGALMDLDTGLPGVGDVAWDTETGRLFALAGVEGSAARPPGLWRLDAELTGVRQTCRPVCVARVGAAHGLVCLPRQVVIVSHTDGSGGLVRITVPDRPADAAAAPQEGR